MYILLLEEVTLLENIRNGPRASFDDELRNTIAEQLNVGFITTTKDLGGTYNLNVLLQTTSGTYVVRVYRPWVTYERVNMVQQVKQVLYKNAFPVAIPVASKAGETIFFYRDRYVEVEHFIPHDEITETWQRYEIAFSLLARLHTCFATQIEHIPFVPPRVSNYGTPDVLLAWTLQAEQRIRQTMNDKNTQMALTLCNDTVELLARMRVWWNGTGHSLPRQLTHGDYGTGNLLFQKERVVAILDFDFLAVRERIFDIAYTLYWMFRRIEGSLSPDNLSWSRVGAMLKCYSSASTHPLTEMEIQALPLTIACVPLYWIAEAHILSDPAQIIVRLAANVRFSHWVTEHSDELVYLFMRAIE